MKFLVLLRLSFLLVFLALSWGAAAETLAGKVVRVVDGDTLVLLASGSVEERIRLSGIDCPERKQAFGTRAKQALLERVGGEAVTIEWDKRDRWERIVGKVIDGEGDVNLALVRKEMCWWYRKYAHEQSDVDQALYEAAEGKARREGKGLWQKPDPVPPWKWRRR